MMVATAVAGRWMTQRTGPPTANRSNIVLAVFPFTSVSTSRFGSATSLPGVCDGEGEGEGDGEGDGEGEGDGDGEGERDGDGDDEVGGGDDEVGTPAGRLVGDPAPGVVGVTSPTAEALWLGDDRAPAGLEAAPEVVPGPPTPRAMFV